MKLRNKLNPNKFGEIVPYDNKGNVGIAVKTDQGIVWYYHSLAELNAEWEDYEEPKERWYINENGGVLKYVPSDPEGEDLAYMKYQNEIGNYFETKEEAEKAVEKLKAWKRLKDKEFEFVGCFKDNTINFEFVGHPLSYDEAEEAEKDLNLLFGGEE